MNESELERLYSRLLDDREFNRLGLLKKQPNIFSALGVDKHEIRHSNFLAWLLRPNESHGIGDLFLTRFLRDILLDDRCKDISLFELPNFNLSKTVVFREWNNIDLVIQIDNVVIAIENKFMSNEHSGQLKRYKGLVDEHFKKERKIFVYLTPYGVEASENEIYINYSYERIIEILDELILLHKNSLINSTAIYIADYINAIKLLVMENSPINELALKIYKNHKELLDLILEIKPDSIRLFDDLLRNYIEAKGYILGSQNKGYVRFLPKDLNEIIPKGYNKNWTQREAFLFEFVNWSNNKISLKAVVAAFDDEARRILSPVLETVSGAQKPSGAMWLTYYQIYIPINHLLLYEKGDEAIKEKLNNEWSKIEGMISKISASILSKREELIELINKRNTINA